MLKSVYEDVSNNYMGSAQQELETYLDSVEAKTTKVKESWAQLWQSDNSTSAMKTVLDMTNGVVEAIGFLGPGKTAAGIATAALSQSLGWGGINQQLVLN